MGWLQMRVGGVQQGRIMRSGVGTIDGMGDDVDVRPISYGEAGLNSASGTLYCVINVARLAGV